MKLASSIIAILLAAITLSAQPSTITYQGKLLDAGGAPVTNSSLSMEFCIYSASSGGTLIWGPETKSVNVQDGMYTVYLGETTVFDASHFSGAEDRYLEVIVGSTTLPRTKLRVVPYAFKALSLTDEAWASPGAIGSTAPSTGVFTNLTANTSFTSANVNINGGTIDGTSIGAATPSGGSFTSLAVGGSPVLSSAITDATLSGNGTSANPLGIDLNNANNWTGAQTYSSVDINGGTIDGTSIGAATPSGGSFTSLAVGGSPVLSSATTDATLNGNGTSGAPLAIDLNNSNSWTAAQTYSAVDINGGTIDGTSIGALSRSGGSFTGLSSNNGFSVTGGDIDLAPGGVSGTNGNLLTCDASGNAVWLPPTGGGWGLLGNSGTNPGVNFLGTADNNALEVHVNSARVMRFEPNATCPNIIGGNNGNTVAGGVEGAVISGGGSSTFTNEVNADFGTVGGGEYNSANGAWATVGGGGANDADQDFGTVGGGELNYAGGSWATIAGGEENCADGEDAAICGGYYNDAVGDATAICGGCANIADGLGAYVGGGFANYAEGDWSTIGGGGGNYTEMELSTICGGELNYTSSSWSIVGGGYYNTADGRSSFVGGGNLNASSGNESAILGGESNTASGLRAVIPGGYNNTAGGDYSFAFGNGVSSGAVNYTTCFYDGANSGTFTINRDADDGISYPVHVGTDGTNGNGAHLTAGGVWTNGSSIEFKDRFKPLNKTEVLQKIVNMDISGWFYKETQEYHIWPYAEDFREAFGTGVLNNPDSHKYLAGADIAGVGLVAIQALNELVETLEAKLEQKEVAVSELSNENESMKARMDAMEAKLNELSRLLVNDNFAKR